MHTVYIFVVPKGTRENYYKCGSRKWWKKIVGTVEKAKLAENKAYKNRFNASMRWLKHDVLPTIFSVLHCIKIDQFLTLVRDSGFERMETGAGISRHNMIVNDYFNEAPEEVFKGIEIHKASCDDFVNILSEFNKTAYSSEMQLKALNLCNALKLDEAKKKLQEAHTEHLIEEYKRMHRPDKSYVNGMYDCNITEFRNEQQINAEYPFSMYG